ncbi:MAG: TfoX/Sxy family protein [Nocardioidaceae bacterium]
MAYDTELAERLRDLLLGEDGLSEKRMFGGLAFLINGNMAVAASSRGGLLLRCDPDQTATLLGGPHVGPFEMRGREMTGWLRVDPEAVATDEQLQQWVAPAVAYVRAMQGAEGT